jgi:hypothetical protein
MSDNASTPVRLVIVVPTPFGVLIAESTDPDEFTCLVDLGTPGRPGVVRLRRTDDHWRVVGVR